MGLANYIPIATGLFCAFFFVEIFQHWQKHRQSLHLLWWTAGIFFYGAGTIPESIHTLSGYHPANFKAWYILGAILGGAPLAQGTVYLLMKRKTANLLSIILILVFIASSILVILSPLKPVDDRFIKLSGKLFEWQFIRYITPFINLYAFIFLVGGAIYSAFLYSKSSIDKSRFWGNVLIAIGGLLPGLGGSLSKVGGHIEILHITALLGISCIHAGYQTIRSSSLPSIYAAQAKPDQSELS
ncbi:MAG: hypothetical protein EOP56_03135 [Sphingobacteriales bacterium]|nr:MAG: hypothetical protein EOP56_03135 [Sphingobacteriales bacterium]